MVSPKLKNNIIIGSQMWVKDLGLTYEAPKFISGYIIDISNKIRFTPYLTIGQNNLSFFEGSGNKRTKILSSNKTTYGIGGALDIKFFKGINTIPDGTSLKSKFDHGLKLSFHVGKAHTLDIANKMQYTLGLSYYAFVRFAK